MRRGSSPELYLSSPSKMLRRNFPLWSNKINHLAFLWLCIRNIKVLQPSMTPEISMKINDLLDPMRCIHGYKNCNSLFFNGAGGSPVKAQCSVTLCSWRRGTLLVFPLRSGSRSADTLG